MIGRPGSFCGVRDKEDQASISLDLGLPFSWDETIMEITGNLSRNTVDVPASIRNLSGLEPTPEPSAPIPGILSFLLSGVDAPQAPGTFND